ncbi:MerR family transcriptional regulator [Cellulosimicrobium funkei]
MLRTSDVARATGWSVQQVRDLEALGVLPPAGRSPNGYRTFGDEHVLALRAYRGLATAVGPVVARAVLREVRTLPLPDAAARVGALHVTLARERDEALVARRALLAIRAEGGPTGETGPDEGGPSANVPAGAAGDEDDVLTITGLAAALGVRASTLRHWEREGLVAPERVATRAGTHGARAYPPAAVREARITAALRSAGYPVPAVRETIAALRRLDDGAPTLAALDARLDASARRTVALLAAGSDVARLLTGATEQPG